MKRILFTQDTLTGDERERLRNEGFEIIPDYSDLTTEEELIERLRGCDGYILGGEEIVTARVLEAVRDHLKVVTYYGTGYEKYIDVPAARKYGIVVTNTPHANARAVAEFTVALLLSVLKNVVEMNNEVKNGVWNKTFSWDLDGKTVGIVGMGHIGEIVSRILHFGFNMNVLYYSRTRKTSVEQDFAKYVPLDELLRTSDVISLHLPYSKDTIGIIGQDAFDLMKNTAILVNTARADLVDPVALKRALEDNRIAAAAFDGYYQEPAPSLEDDPYGLMCMQDGKFILTPHAAWCTEQAVKKLEAMAIENTVNVLSGRPCKYIVS